MTTQKSTAPVASVVLAAGQGTRMKSSLPKVLHPIGGRPMIVHLLDTLSQINPERVVVVISDHMDDVASAVAPHPTAVQQKAQGTGDAVRCALPALEGFDGDVLVLFGADPLITPDTLQMMIERRREEDDPAVVILGFRPNDPGQYGRLVMDEDGTLEAIVEARDASPDQLEIELCNSGVMAIDGKRLTGLVKRIENNNAKSEFYLTDIVALAREDGDACAVVEGNPDELHGVDNRIDLAQAEWLLQVRLRSTAMIDGVTMIEPETITLSADTEFGTDVTLEPNIFFGPGVRVGNNVTIKAFSHIEGAHIGDNAVIGPFARLRPGADLGEDVRVGNFVEVKNSKIEAGAKANHLSYIGDSTIGEKANIGAGTITCNYDGFLKSRTVIGKGAFIGSNTALVAPVTIGDGAIIGAGSTIARDVNAEALAVTRAPQKQVEGWASRFRTQQAAKKKQLIEKNKKD